MTQAMYFIQTPKQVVMILSSKQEIRRIYLNVPHSDNLKPSWYGESVGHYEGDTLVVDTIGIDERTWVDAMGTPHTEAASRGRAFPPGRRWRRSWRRRFMSRTRAPSRRRGAASSASGNTSWRCARCSRSKASRSWRARAEGPLQELICADNPSSFFENQDAEPAIPQATKPDF